MKKDNRENLYKKVIKTWGMESQLNMLIEECSELITAICHYRRERVPLTDVTEEIADVEILIEQIRMMIGGSLVDSVKHDKLQRLKKTLANSENKPSCEFKRGQEVIVWNDFNPENYSVRFFYKIASNGMFLTCDTTDLLDPCWSQYCRALTKDEK